MAWETEIYYLTVLAARSPKSRCWQGWFLLKDKELLLKEKDLPLACRWLSSSSQVILPLSCFWPFHLLFAPESYSVLLFPLLSFQLYLTTIFLAQPSAFLNPKLHLTLSPTCSHSTIQPPYYSSNIRHCNGPFYLYKFSKWQGRCLTCLLVCLQYLKQVNK